MLVLDTDHLSVPGDPSAAGERLLKRLKESGEPVVTTVVNVEDSLRGWLAQIHRAAGVEAELIACLRFQRRVEFFSEWTVLPWDSDAARRFRYFRSQRLRTATLDLRIACICLEHDALLLSRNTKDFCQVPGLRIENWLD
jgi:tRNA(fMet)-specific endonuclease VapC